MGSKHSRRRQIKEENLKKIAYSVAEKQLEINKRALSLRRQLGQSMCFIEVFRFCSQEQLVRLQLLSKRRYYQYFAFTLVEPPCIFRPRPISLATNSPCIRLLEVSAAEGCVWRDFLVSEQGEFHTHRKEYFQGKSQYGLT